MQRKLGAGVSDQQARHGSCQPMWGAKVRDAHSFPAPLLFHHIKYLVTLR